MNLSELKSQRRRWLFGLVVNVFVLLSALALRPRARAHWLGHQHRRPRRLERPLLFTIIGIAPLVLNIDQYLLWLSFWGVGTVLLISFSVVHRASRRRYHWVRK